MELPFQDSLLPVPADAHAPKAGYWTEDRCSLLSWFTKNAPVLGELYAGAVELVYGNYVPGKGYFVCHAVREIRNRLPDVIAGPRIGGNLNYKDRLDGLAKAWSTAGFFIDGPTAGANVAEDIALPASGDIPLSRELFRQIEELLMDHQRARERPIESAYRMFEAVARENPRLDKVPAPIMKHWIKTTDWFVDYTHVHNTPDIFSRKELSSRFEVFEGMLKSLLGEFFKGIDEIDAILQDANV